MKKIAALIALLIVLMTANAFAGEIIDIVCTDFVCYDFARQVAGELGRVTMLIKPGVEAHSYEPSPADILAIGEADLFIYIGGESDAWADKILDTFGEDAPETLRMMEVVKGVEAEEHDHNHDQNHDYDYKHDAAVYDEHIWLSPANAKEMVKALGDKLNEIYGGAPDRFSDAAEVYVSEIDKIDAAIREIVESANRHELVFGDRFPFIYFTEAYGLEYHAAFESCTAETEPSPMTLMMLIEKVKGEDIPVIYTIEMSTQNVARTISEETGCEILTLHSMQTVTQEEFEAGESYVSIMLKNVEAIRKGLN